MTTPVRIRFKVTECSAYVDARLPTYAQLLEQAWILRPTTGRRLAGFVRSSELRDDEFRKDLKGSDFLHWGEGMVAISPKSVSFTGKLAPGPDYKLYFSPEYVETKEEFLRIKAKARRAGDIRTFENFIVPLPAAFDPAQYNTVVVWCETFSMFISAAKYR